VKQESVTRRCGGLRSSRRVADVVFGARSVALALVLATALGAMGCSSWRAANLYQSGTRALDAGALQQAVSELEMAAKLEPQRSEIRNHLGLAYAASGDAIGAEASFAAAVAIDCDNDAARRNLAALHAGELRRMPSTEPVTMQRSDESARVP
jgi:Flp pilus assembly protein TadD